jgi:hypothetical protein
MFVFISNDDFAHLNNERIKSNLIPYISNLSTIVANMISKNKNMKNEI